MKHSFLRLVCAACVVLCCLSALHAQEAGAATAVQPEPAQSARGGIATLYALDPLARTLCLRDGRKGLMFAANRVTNRCSDLNYALAGGGSFVTGIEANRVGSLLDLGTADELRARYGFDDAEGGGEGFASLRIHEGKLVILKEDRPQEKLQPLREASALFADVRSSATAPVKLGHIYLVQITDTKDRSFQLIVKLMVIAYTANQSVTVRWEAL